MKRARGGEAEKYLGYFCAKCGKKVGDCSHMRLFFYLGKYGEFVVAE
jgi:hypothetical protein